MRKQACTVCRPDSLIAAWVSHRHLHPLPAKLPEILSQCCLLVRHRSRLHDLASCFHRRHVTKSLVKIYANVDHHVPPSGLVLRARTLPLEARFCFHYI